MTKETKSRVYINGRLIGFHPTGERLVHDLIQRRRQGKLGSAINIAYHEDTNEIYINTDAGRVQRPLVVIENGKPKLTEDMVRQVKEGKLAWQDLVDGGIIEYLDAEEEENALIAADEEEPTKEHTHMEVAALSILSR